MATAAKTLRHLRLGLCNGYFNFWFWFDSVAWVQSYRRIQFQCNKLQTGLSCNCIFVSVFFLTGSCSGTSHITGLRLGDTLSSFCYYSDGWCSRMIGYCCWPGEEQVTVRHARDLLIQFETVWSRHAMWEEWTYSSQGSRGYAGWHRLYGFRSGQYAMREEWTYSSQRGG